MALLLEEKEGGKKCGKHVCVCVHFAMMFDDHQQSTVCDEAKSYRRRRRSREKTGIINDFDA